MVWEYGTNIQFKISLFGQYFIYVTCSYSNKNIEPNFLEKNKNMKKCWNLQNLRTTEPQKILMVLIKKVYNQ